MRVITLLRLSTAGIMLILAGGCASLNWPSGKPTQAPPSADTQQRSPSVATTSVATTASAADAHRASLAGRAIDASKLGYFMDVHEARLRQAVVDSPISLRRDESRLALVIPGNTGFTTGSSTLGPDVAEPLATVAAVLSEFDRTLITVNGHTDNSGTSTFNQQLSQQRAMAVARFFRQQGIHAERLVALGHGEKQPLADNETAEGRATNRRTEIFIEPVVADKESRAVSSPLNED